MTSTLFEDTKKVLKKHALMLASDLLATIQERIDRVLNPEEYLSAFKFFSDRKPTTDPLMNTAIETGYFNSPSERISFWESKDRFAPKLLSKEQVENAEKIRDKYRVQYDESKFLTAKELDSSLTAIPFFKNIGERKKVLETALAVNRFESPDERISFMKEKDPQPPTRMTRSQWSDREREKFLERYSKIAPLPSAAELNKLEFVEDTQEQKEEISAAKKFIETIGSTPQDRQRTDKLVEDFATDLRKSIKDIFGTEPSITIKNTEED